jgi:hypothetical protein
MCTPMGGYWIIRLGVVSVWREEWEARGSRDIVEQKRTGRKIQLRFFWWSLPI